MKHFFNKLKSIFAGFSPILINEFKKTFPIYFLGVIANGVQAIIHFAIPFVIGQILDLLILGTSSKEEIIGKAYLLTFVSILSFFPRATYRRLCFTSARISDTKLRKEAIKHLQYVKPEYYEREDKGTFLAYVSKELLSIRKFLGNFFWNLGRLLLNPIIVLIIISVKYSWHISLIIFLILIIVAIFIFKLYKELNSQIEKARVADINLFNIVEQNTSGFSLIKLYNQQENQIKKFKELNKKRHDADYCIGVVKNKISNLENILYSICYVIIFGLGILLIKNDMLTVGGLTALITCITFVMSEVISSIQPLMEGIAYFKQSTKRFNYFFSLETYKNNGEKLNDINTIKLKDLSYSYDNKNNVLNGINLEIKSNEKIGIIGQVGSGKTTLMNILSGFLEVQDNMVFINDVDINKYSRDEIFKNVGYATQKNIILNDSIENNINITKSENIDAEGLSKVSELYLDITEMENKFRTIIGEKGSKLSGGQRQRLQIARTLSCIKKINIFDDTLSALDSVTEKKVLNSIINETKNNILIVVSNKVSSMENLDRIYILIDGKICGEGTHKELLDTNDLYKELYNYEREGELA